MTLVQKSAPTPHANPSVDLSGARRFLARVLPGCAGTFKNIHYFVEKPPEWKGKNRPSRGYGCGSIDELLQQLAYVLGRPETQDVYFCTSEVSERGERIGKSRSHKAVRLADKSAAHKLFCVDLDAGDKNYPDAKAAVGALKDILRDAGIPLFNAVVWSGSGGLHVYWILHDAVHPDDWQPLSHALVHALKAGGLKFDAGCTTDRVRIMRVPGTWNWKGGVRKDVKLLSLAEHDISNYDMETALAPFVGKSNVVPFPGTSGFLPGNFGPLAPAFGDVAHDELGAGIATPPQLIIDDVAERCAWISDTLANGGADNANPLWFLSLRIAEFVADSDDVAHRLSNGHATYSAEETQRRLDEMRMDRERNPKLGWPSCAKIHEAGAPQCSNCPHFAEGKSPLNVRRALASVATDAQQVWRGGGGLPDIPGGVYGPREILPAISARFSLLNRAGEVTIIRRGAAGDDETLSAKDFDLYLANVFVSVGGDDEQKPQLAARYWLHHPSRPAVRQAVFRPHGPIADHEYNFWTGFGVGPEPGRDKLWRFFRHTWKVICNSDPSKFRYILNWCAWAVQHPDKNPEAVIVIKGRGEGSGKTTLSDAMCRIFGKHGTIISDPEQLIGRHVDNLEFKSFVMIEEALFAGDPREASRVRSRITSRAISVNPKHRKAYDAPNIMHAILTTNHDWAVHAGKSARRWFVVEASERATFDAQWFKALNYDLDNGGLQQLLHFLLHLDLGDWHPRQIVRTFELAQQQLLSANSVEQWLWACAEAGQIPTWIGVGAEGAPLELGKGYWTSTLYKAYVGHSKNGSGGRIDTQIAFGRKLMEIFGAKGHDRNMRGNGGAKRSPGYHIPEPKELRRMLAKSIGIRIDLTTR